MPFGCGEAALGLSEISSAVSSLVLGAKRFRIETARPSIPCATIHRPPVIENATKVVEVLLMLLYTDRGAGASPSPADTIQ